MLEGALVAFLEDLRVHTDYCMEDLKLVNVQVNSKPN